MRIIAIATLLVLASAAPAAYVATGATSMKMTVTEGAGDTDRIQIEVHGIATDPVVGVHAFFALRIDPEFVQVVQVFDQSVLKAADRQPIPNYADVTVNFIGRDEANDLYSCNFLECFLTSYSVTPLDGTEENTECIETVDIALGYSEFYLGKRPPLPRPWELLRDALLADGSQRFLIDAADGVGHLLGTHQQFLDLGSLEIELNPVSIKRESFSAVKSRF